MPARLPPKDYEAEPHPARPRPTVDEKLAALARHNKACVDFLKTDVAAGLTFAETARTARTSSKRERNRHSARRAYDTVTKLIGRVTLTEFDAKILGRDLARLKSELRGLGESF